MCYGIRKSWSLTIQLRDKCLRVRFLFLSLVTHNLFSNQRYDKKTITRPYQPHKSYRSRQSSIAL